MRKYLRSVSIERIVTSTGKNGFAIRMPDFDITQQYFRNYADSRHRRKRFKEQVDEDILLDQLEERNEPREKVKYSYFETDHYHNKLLYLRKLKLFGEAHKLQQRSTSQKVEKKDYVPLSEYIKSKDNKPATFKVSGGRTQALILKKKPRGQRAWNSSSQRAPRDKVPMNKDLKLPLEPQQLEETDSAWNLERLEKQEQKMIIQRKD